VIKPYCCFSLSDFFFQSGTCSSLILVSTFVVVVTKRYTLTTRHSGSCPIEEVLAYIFEMRLLAEGTS
jgi:hypothetical protein